MPEIACEPYIAHHCESGMLVNLLRHGGIDLSEPMVFGLARGFNFTYWKSKAMPFPFIGGRIKPDGLTANLAETLDLDLVVSETASPRRAWAMIEKAIASGKPIGLKLDHYFLDYFPDKNFHFCAHYVALYGYDSAQAYLIDTRSGGGVNRTSLESLAAARAARGPMSSPHLSVMLGDDSRMHTCIERDRKVLRARGSAAIRRNAEEYLNPPIRNLGFKGVHHASLEVRGWQKDLADPSQNLVLIGKLIEQAGTGGGLFRRIYADFLAEMHEISKCAALLNASRRCRDIADLWTAVSERFVDAGRSGEQRPLLEASKLLETIAIGEKSMMGTLAAALQADGPSALATEATQ